MSVCIPDKALDLTEVQTIDGCELPYGCWELNSGTLGKCSVLVITESSFQAETESLYIALTVLELMQTKLLALNLQRSSSLKGD